MKSFAWPPNFVAKCPVSLFEASGGSLSWRPSSTVGELHMKPLGNSVMRFEIYDLLDKQVLFEHTMRKPDSFIISAPRFFVIRLENGSFRGLGFKEKMAANEMKGQIEMAAKPFSICNQMQEAETITKLPAPPTASSSSPQRLCAKKPPEVQSYESIPKRRSATRATLKQSNEQPASPMQPPVPSTFTPASKTRKFRLQWRILVKSLATFSHLVGFKEHEMEIGYPTDVKHVAHIGWDGPTINEHSWMDELRPAPDFSSGPLRDFGQPKRSDWIHDALFAAKWSTPGLSEGSQLPPVPPLEFQDEVADSKHSNKQKEKSPKQKIKQKSRKHQAYSAA